MKPKNMKPKNMKRAAIFLREDQLKKLNEVLQEVGVPVAEQIRRAIDAYLKERGK